MGRVRQKDIKRTAAEIVRRYKDELTGDFKKDREFLNDILKIEGKFMRNRISGYVTRLLKRKKGAANAP